MTIAVALTVLCLLAVGVVAMVRLAARARGRSLSGVVRCAARGACRPVRHPLGPFRCADCGTAGADLDEMPGYSGQGYVASTRRVMDSDRRASGRTTEWTPSLRRGRW